MKRFTSLIRPKSSVNHVPNHPNNSPEATGLQAIRSFCEIQSTSDEEGVLHLPVIVESAESSPSAAAAAAQLLKKFLGREYAQKEYVQYNAVMLVRILCDNPGPTFTKNFDVSFVKAVKDLLRQSKNPGTQQILRQTLDSLEVNKPNDESLKGLLQMWRKEKGHAARLSHPQSGRAGGPPSAIAAGQSIVNPYPTGPTTGQAYGGGATFSTLPPPQELSSRIAEARNTAKILLQFIQSTPSEEVLSNGLLREFGDRCQGAQRSMQTYINCQNPEPDHDTMQTLIETNEQLSLAVSRYQRALLAARRAMGISPSPSHPEQSTQTLSVSSASLSSAVVPPAGHSLAQSNGAGYQQQSNDNVYSTAVPLAPSNLHPQSQAPFSNANPQQPTSNPFADPMEHNRNAAPLAMESISHVPAHRQQPDQTFSIDAEPTYVHTQTRNGHGDHSGNYLPNPMGGSQSSSPQIPPSATGDSQYTISPQASPDITAPAPQPAHSGGRPAIGPWHHSDVTQSYMGRQASALNGLTMHGAQTDEEVSEIDGNSQVGRKDHNPTRNSAFGISR